MNFFLWVGVALIMTFGALGTFQSGPGFGKVPHQSEILIRMAHHH